MRFVPQYFRNGWDSKVEIVKSLLLREKGDRLRWMRRTLKAPTNITLLIRHLSVTPSPLEKAYLNCYKYKGEEKWQKYLKYL